MWTWFQENSSALSAIANILTLAISTLYLQLLFREYRRAKRAKILISRGAGHSIDARCIISNMSSQPIYLEALILALHELQRDEKKNQLSAP